MSQPTLRDYKSPSAVFQKWYLGPSRSWHNAKVDEPHHEVADRSQNKNSASAEYASKYPYGQVPYEQVPLNVRDSNSIRLLEILPNTSDDSTISCMLHSASTEHDYTALSYMWGGEEDQKMIMLNGIKILVRRNLWNFLRQKEIDQRENGTQLFWIDALCINQADLAERNQQVAMMGKIYRQASSVLVWLGSETRTMELFEDMNDRIGKTDNDTYDEWMAAFRRGERSDRHLFYHEYWTRAWILQECVLASLLKLQCGPHIVHERQLYHLDAFRQSSWKYAATEMSPCRMVLQARTDWHNPVNRTYMQPFGNWDHLPQCSDPRDRIFSKLAMMSPSIAITPDYSKTAVELFREVAEKYIVWDTKCYSRLQSLAVTLDLAPDDWSDSGFLQASDPGIREIILRAELIWDYVASGETEEDFFDRNWNEYVHVVLPSETLEWLQTTRAGRELPNVLRDCLHNRCTIGAGALGEETPLPAAQCFEYDTLAEMGTRKQKLEAEMAPHGLGVKQIAEEK